MIWKSGFYPRVPFLPSFIYRWVFFLGFFCCCCFFGVFCSLSFPSLQFPHCLQSFRNVFLSSSKDKTIGIFLDPTSPAMMKWACVSTADEFPALWLVDLALTEEDETTRESRHFGRNYNDLVHCSSIFACFGPLKWRNPRLAVSSQ